MNALKEHPALTRSFQRLPLPAQMPVHREHPLSLNATLPPHTRTERNGKIKNILVPTDFSACSAEALTRAAELARRHNAKLTILHVIDINPPSALTHCGTAEDLMRQLRVAGMSGLRRITESLARTQIKMRTLILEGLPAETIVEYSAGFDLLVIGEGRPKSAWNFFSRHTARRVIERAECAVQVVREAPGSIEGRSKPKEDIAVR